MLFKNWYRIEEQDHEQYKVKQYKVKKKGIQKAVASAKENAYEDMYHKLD